MTVRQSLSYQNIECTKVYFNDFAYTSSENSFCLKKILYIKYCKLQIHKYCIKAQMQKRIINNSEYLLKKV